MELFKRFTPNLERLDSPLTSLSEWDVSPTRKKAFLEPFLE